ncbi:MAG: outer membrane beta-barrel protein [Planctomycetota bacterium]
MRSWGGRLAVLLVVAASLGCAATPRGQAPTYAWYTKATGQAVFADIQAQEGADDQGPEEGFGLTVGWVDAVSYDDAWGVEGTFEQSYPSLSGGGGGRYSRYMAGMRHVWDLDEKVKTALSFGAAWHAIRFSDASHDYSIDGFGLWVGYGFEFALSERWWLGVGGKLHGWRGRNQFERDYELSTVFDLGISYYF